MFIVKHLFKNWYRVKSYKDLSIEVLESDIPETAPGEDEPAKYQVKIDELKHN